MSRFLGTPWTFRCRQSERDYIERVLGPAETFGWGKDIRSEIDVDVVCGSEDEVWSYAYRIGQVSAPIHDVRGGHGVIGVEVSEEVSCLVRCDITYARSNDIENRNARSAGERIQGIRVRGRGAQEVQKDDRRFGGFEVSDVDRFRNADRADAQLGNRSPDDDPGYVGLSEWVGIVTAVEDLDIEFSWTVGP